jgi:hypothetical protein
MIGNLTKAEETYLYIIKNLCDNLNFGKTLFWKILYFSDFDFYECSQKSITESKYRKLEMGPAPYIFDGVISSLKEKGYIKELSVSRNGGIQKRYVLLKDFISKKLNPDEIKTLNRNINRLKGMTATQVSAFSHEDMPYKATKKGQEINYRLVFYRNPVYSITSQ